MLNSELEFCLNEAFQRAREQRHEFMTVEHLLRALSDVPEVREVLTTCGGSVDVLQDQLKDFIASETPLVTEGYDGDVQPTLGFQRVLQRAVYHVQASGKREVTCVDVLVAIYSEKQSQAVNFLSAQGICRLDVVNVISHRTPLDSAEDENVESLAPHPTASIKGSLDRLEHRQIALEKRLDSIEASLDEIQRILGVNGNGKTSNDAPG